MPQTQGVFQTQVEPFMPQGIDFISAKLEPIWLVGRK